MMTTSGSPWEEGGELVRKWWSESETQEQWFAWKDSVSEMFSLLYLDMAL